MSPRRLCGKYVSNGWWTDESLGDLVAQGLGAMPDATFAVHSAVRPWRGTVADLDRDARRFAGWLRDNDIGPGDIVVFQLPNWVEAAITFWGAAYAGAVVVPVVHFYGAKELEYILRVTEPALVVTADRFGQVDYLASYSELLGDLDTRWAVVGTDPDELPPHATPFGRLLDPSPSTNRWRSTPTHARVGRLHLRDDPGPKGRHPLAPDHRVRGPATEQISLRRTVRPPITGAPVGHFIGMLSAFVCSLIRRDAINLLDVWNPAEVLRLMREEGLGVSGGATYFVTSLLDHPDFTEEHLEFMPYAGMGGSPVPVAFTERASKLGIKVYRSYGSTEQPSITGSHVDEPEQKRLATDGLPLPGVEMQARRGGPDFQPWSRALHGLHGSRIDLLGVRRRGVVSHRRCGCARRRRLPHDHRPHLRHHHPRW